MRPMPPIHPAATIFPMLPETQLREMAEDIRTTRQRDPIILWRGQLLDGRNRWMACDRAGVEPKVERRDDITDPVAFVLSVNLHRRHLDESQRAMAAARARALLSQPPEPDPQLVIEAANLPATAEPPRPPMTYSDATSMLHVSERSVRHAKLVLATGIPELAQRVDAGQTAVSAAAAVATLPAGQQIEVVARGEREIIAKAKEIRASRGAIRRAERTENLVRIARGNVELATDVRYPVVYADPPWLYDSGTTDPSRIIANKYPPMPLDEIKALPVGKLATEIAILFMWATNPMLPEALAVIEAWGFKYKTNIAWDKEIAGAGYWVRGQHELLLIATRGDMPTPPEALRPSSVLRSRRGEHSAKPDEAAALILRMFPSLPKIEMFARQEREGFTVWGNQVTAGAQVPLPAAPEMEAAGDLADDAAGDADPDEVDFTSEDMDGAACLDCKANPGEPHGEKCDDFPLIVPLEGPGQRMACWSRGTDPLETADGLTARGAELVAERWQRMKGVTRIEIADCDGNVIERREKAGKAWSVRTEKPQEEPAPAGGPLVCRAPSPAEQEQMAREFPEFVKRLDAPAPLPATHPARASKRVGALIRHAESAIAARNFDSAKDAIDEAEPLRLPSVDPEHVADAVAKLRALLAWAQAQPGADDEPTPPKNTKAPKAKRVPVEPAVEPEHLDITCDDKTRAKLVKAISAAYSGDLTNTIRKPVDLDGDGNLWTNMGGTNVKSAHTAVLWRLVPIEEWPGSKDTYDAGELVERYESGATWRGDRHGYQVSLGARIFVLVGPRRVYRWTSP